jgi:hypothetical protein
VPFSYVVMVDGADPKTIAASGLPPGLELADHEIAGTPTEVGEFPVTLAIDTPGGSISPTVTITIEPNPNTGPSDTTLDSDGDGFPDEIETAAGSSPMSSTSTPAGSAPAGPASPLPGTKLKATLDFAHAGHDSLSFRCTLPIPAGFDVSAPLVVDVGGVVRSLRIARRRLKPRGGAVAAQTTKLAMTVKRSALAPLLADEGLTSADLKNVQRTVPVAVLSNGGMLSADHPVTYSAKAGKLGRAR